MPNRNKELIIVVIIIIVIIIIIIIIIKSCFQRSRKGAGKVLEELMIYFKLIWQ